VRWPRNIRRFDLANGLPFADGSVGVVNSSHMLEHLARADAVRFLVECRRVLRLDGLLRLALPDLRRMAERYLASADSEASDAFVRATGLGWDARPKGVAWLVEIESGARHRWMHDALLVRRLSWDAKFTDVYGRDYREGRCPDLSVVEYREDSFFVEASVARPD
jgi:SAM-dependent methyltransferase